MERNLNRHRRYCVLLFAVVAVLGILFWRPWVGSGYDDIGYYAHLSSPLFDGDLDPLNDVYFSNDPLGTVQNYSYTLSPTGRCVNFFAIGSSALRAPFIVPLRAFGGLVQTVSPSVKWPGDRYSLPYMWAYGAGTFVYFAAGVLLVYLTSLKFVSARSAFFAACCAAAATQWTGYGTIYNGMAHGISAFAVSLLLYATVISRKLKTITEYLFIAAATAIVFLVRWQDAAIIVLPLTIIVYRVRHWNSIPDKRREIARMLAALGIGIALAASQMGNWYYIYNKFITIPQGSGYLVWGKPHMIGVLFSPFYGLFYYHPILFLGAAGLLIGSCTGHGRGLFIGMAAAAATMIYVDSTSGEWHGSYGYGHRRLTSIVPLLAVGLAFIFERLRFRRHLFALTTTLVFCSINIILFVLLIRNQLRLFFWSELMELPLRIVGETAAQVISTLGYNQGAAGALYYERSSTLAAVSVLTSLAGAALGCVLALRVIPRISKTKVVHAALAICSLCYALFCAVQPREETACRLQFRSMAPNKYLTDPSQLQLAQLNNMWDEGCRFPGLPLWAIQGKKTDEPARRVWLERLNEIDRALWAKAVLDPNMTKATELERQTAGNFARKTPGNFTQVLSNEIAQAGKSGDTDRITHAFKKHLRFYPLSTTHLFVLSKLTLDKAEAATIQNRVFLIDEAYVRAMLLNMARLPQFWRGYIFERSYVDRVNVLINHYRASNSPQKAMELYNRVFDAGLVRPVSAHMVKKPLQH